MTTHRRGRITINRGQPDERDSGAFAVHISRCCDNCCHRVSEEDQEADPEYVAWRDEARGRAAVGDRCRRRIKDVVQMNQGDHVSQRTNKAPRIAGLSIDRQAQTPLARAARGLVAELAARAENSADEALPTLEQAVVDVLPRATSDNAANDDTPAAAASAVAIMAATLTAPVTQPEAHAAADQQRQVEDEDDDFLEDDPDGEEVAAAVDLLRHRALSRQLGTHRRKLIAQRMIEARELNGFPQTEAAGLFGHRNPTQLSLWERGGRIPPLKDLIRAAEVYGCSVDFLLGVSAEADRDPRVARRQASVRAVQSLITHMAERVVDAVDAQNELVGPGSAAVRKLVEKTGALALAAEKFTRMNARKFEDMRGGSALIHALAEIEPVLAGATEMLRRFDKRQAALDAALRGQLAGPALASGSSATVDDSEGGTTD